MELPRIGQKTLLRPKLGTAVRILSKDGDLSEPFIETQPKLL